ncbi:MAG: class I SAM-dependent RNA methyltransferase [Firmicutes bacterium]|nr:class I SAM-dependent RNA methyltransferase [Bacillota bacterium]
MEKNTKNDKFTLIASSAFGLEACVKREAIALGFENIKTFDGKVEFSGSFEEIAKANLHFRTAGRIWLKMGSFPARSFEELFQGTRALPWGDLIPPDGKFTVTGKSVRSALFSVPDCQSIVKKAVVEKLKEKYALDWFDETGPSYTIEVGLLKDVATLLIDTTGSGLHKRGYRENALDAPLKETMATAMLDLSFWNRDRVLLDPLCGSGTIPIEAAMIARNIAPGLGRKFASEEWPQMAGDIWKKARAEAYRAIDYDFMPKIYGSDIDEAAIELARENAELAGVDDCITFEVCPLEERILPANYGVMVANPPYGERLGDMQPVEELYRSMGALMRSDPTWSAYVLTSMEYFESLFGKKADAKRKLFNGRIKTDYYQFYGPRPPRG